MVPRRGGAGGWWVGRRGTEKGGKGGDCRPVLYSAP